MKYTARYPSGRFFTVRGNLIAANAPDSDRILPMVIVSERQRWLEIDAGGLLILDPRAIVESDKGIRYSPRANKYLDDWAIEWLNQHPAWGADDITPIILGWPVTWPQWFVELFSDTRLPAEPMYFGSSMVHCIDCESRMYIGPRQAQLSIDNPDCQLLCIPCAAGLRGLGPTTEHFGNPWTVATCN